MFNKLLEEAGEFGLFQKCLTFGFFLLSMAHICLLNWMQIFILMVAPHRCKRAFDDDTWPGYDSSNRTVAATECSLEFSAENTSEWAVDHNASDTDYFGKETCPFGWVYDFSSMHQTFATEHNLLCGDAWKMYALHVSFYSGAFIGALIAGWIIDKYGRKRAFQVCLLLSLASDVATVLAPNVFAFAVARFFSSVGGSNLSTVSYVLAMEYTGPKYRLVNLAVWSLTFTTVSTIVPWIAHQFNHWQHIMALAFLTYALVLFISCFIPESASWLMTRDKLHKTAELIHKVSRINRKEIPMDHILSELEKEKKEISNSKSETSKSKHSALDLCRTPHIRKNTILLCILWMIASACYVGNNLESGNLPYPWYLSYSIGGISELPANLVCLFALDKIGRRWTNVFFFTLGGGLGIAAGKFIQDRTAIMVVSMIVRLCYAATFDITFTFSSELFPTAIRGRGILLIRAFGAISNALSPFVVYLSEKDKLLPMVVLGLFSLCGGLLNLFLPETARQHLPHTIEDGESFGKDQPFCFCPFTQVRNKKASRAVKGEENKGFDECTA